MKLIVYSLATFSFVRGYFFMFFSSMKFLWDINLLLVHLNYNKFLEILIKEKLLYIGYILFIISFILSSINGLYFNSGINLKNNFIQFLYLNSFWIIVLTISKITYKESLKLLKFIIYFSAFQFVVDMYLMKNLSMLQYTLDVFHGTFQSANQKSRYLLIIILIIISLIGRGIFKKNILTFTILIFVAISYVIGFSEITYLFLFLSTLFTIFTFLILDLMKKFIVPLNVKLLVLVFGLIVSCIIYFRFINIPNFKSAYLIASERFLSTETGVFAVILYTFNKLFESNLLGTGFGTFMSRIGTSSVSSVLDNAPGVQVVYGYLSVNTTIDGYSSLFNILMEGGVIGLTCFIILLYFIFNIKKASISIFYIFIVFYFIFNVLYVPYFFDNEFGVLFTITFLLYKNVVYGNPKNTE